MSSSKNEYTRGHQQLNVDAKHRKIAVNMGETRYWSSHQTAKQL